jgi:hypothetical protein
MTSLAYGSRNYRQGADELVRVENIAGIEIYTAAEAPYPYYQPQAPIVITRSTGSTRPTPPPQGGARRAPTTSSSCAVTLIWTK